MAEEASASESRAEPSTPSSSEVPEGYDLIGEDGAVLMKNNRLTIDDARRQALSQAEIEELKQSAGGKEVIEKILANHAGLDEKTSFSRAKYTLRKTKKYLKRFTVLPMNLGNLIDWVTDKEPARILEMREETLGLITAWSNAHFTDASQDDRKAEPKIFDGGRWVVVDDTGGLLVAALAEKMGILFPGVDAGKDGAPNEGPSNGAFASEPSAGSSSPANGLPGEDHVSGGVSIHSDQRQSNGDAVDPKEQRPDTRNHRDFPIPAPTNTITILHPAVQPNASLLRYFGYDTNQPDINHPLHTHLKSLSWLQLLHPADDPTYREPERASESQLQRWKSGKRGTYWKKRRRWERCKAIVDDSRKGEFDGLVVASSMDLASILPHAVPLIRGGGHVVIYSPTVEPLVTLMDLYSRERRTAYISLLSKGEIPNAQDFPLDPRLLLAPTLQTSRVRDWQVLPGRTHPIMTSKGGAEGYVFTARKVIPLEGGVEARGNFAAKKRKVEMNGQSGSEQVDVQAGAEL